ncbi:hypothetical protein SAMN02927900_00490 [Rhizobium mongolense subsp. loessense]|uniref:Uncharacterized protein n=1 Tax=Rhizobium mongolense subsp. loessense TaxID=158890 RepID=A0A1G4PFY0_9HYPH|nr:hypothetical protein SAMN02927900_00490 [Rhizobium mongolense subsp. loessense]
MTSGASIDRPILLRKHQISKPGAFLTEARQDPAQPKTATKSHTRGKFRDREDRAIFFCRVPR